MLLSRESALLKEKCIALIDEQLKKPHPIVKSPFVKGVLIKNPLDYYTINEVPADYVISKWGFEVIEKDEKHYLLDVKFNVVNNGIVEKTDISEWVEIAGIGYECGTNLFIPSQKRVCVESAVLNSFAEITDNNKLYTAILKHIEESSLSNHGYRSDFKNFIRYTGKDDPNNIEWDKFDICYVYTLYDDSLPHDDDDVHPVLCLDRYDTSNNFSRESATYISCETLIYDIYLTSKLIFDEYPEEHVFPLYFVTDTPLLDNELSDSYVIDDSNVLDLWKVYHGIDKLFSDFVSHHSCDTMNVISKSGVLNEINLNEVLLQGIHGLNNETIMIFNKILEYTFFKYIEIDNPDDVISIFRYYSISKR